MDYIREYKRFIYSYYLSDALRVCIGAIAPALVMSYFDSLATGVVVALGATLVSPADSPGPINQRRNGMLIAVVVIFSMALITGFAASHPIWLGIWIAVSCFLCSMISVYGVRAGGIGLSALIVMALTIGRPYTGWDVVTNAGYMAAGAAWYTLLSLVLYKVRPYRLIQQALGEGIMSTADYLRVRALFYNKQDSYESVYLRLIENQVDVQQKQDLLRELLFKSRNLLKESTTTGRTLLMIFIDTVDLFEKAITSFYNYEDLHKYFDAEDILRRFQQIIYEIAERLDNIGIAVKSGRPSKEPLLLQQHIRELQEYFASFLNRHRKPENIEAIITLRKIMQALEDMVARINTLHHYTRYDNKKAKAFSPSGEYEKFISHQDFGWKLLRDNFSIRSNIFRHSVRMSIATVTGYIGSHLFLLGHSYWILLTIIVILKPAYSLSKKRNYQRLVGTVIGALVGVFLLYVFQDKMVLFAWMLLLMIGAYSFLRTNYLVGVVFMTPYVLLMFHLLNTGDYKTILEDRILDTAIGSAIAFVASFVLVPVWEHEQIKNYMASAITDSMNYFKDAAAAFSNNPQPVIQYKLSRKNAFVSLANLSEAFSRMLSEPKSKQKDSKVVHQFVVLNHMLISHIATLSHYAGTFAEKCRSPDFIPLINDTVKELQSAIAILQHENITAYNDSESLFVVDEKVSMLLNKRKDELQHGIIDTDTRKALRELKPIVDQFHFIAGIARDIRKTAEITDKKTS